MSETEYERMFDRWQGIIHEQGRKIVDLTARAEAAEAEVERLTRECLDRENTETDARERLRRYEP